MRLKPKQIKESYKNIIKCGYCELQNLLKGIDKKGYTCGVYGWDADIYQINIDTVIVTGYRTFGNIEADHELSKEYDTKAEEIFKKTKTYSKASEKVNELLNEYIKIILYR